MTRHEMVFISKESANKSFFLTNVTRWGRV